MHTDRSGATCKGKEILSSSSTGNTLYPFHLQANMHPRWLLGVWPGFASALDHTEDSRVVQGFRRRNRSQRWDLTKLRAVGSRSAESGSRFVPRMYCILSRTMSRRDDRLGSAARAFAPRIWAGSLGTRSVGDRPIRIHCKVRKIQAHLPTAVASPNDLDDRGRQKPPPPLAEVVWSSSLAAVSATQVGGFLPISQALV